MLRFIYHNTLPIRLRNYLDIFSSVRGKLNNPELIEKPAGAKVMVLSPHPDDDIIGCGGTLYKHHMAGDEIVSVCMTDGGRGNDEAAYNERLVFERREEAKNAANIIGINKILFLDNRDMELRADRKAIDGMVELLDNIRPDIVYLPSFIDNHPDHIATNDIFVKAIKGYKDFTCYGYEVWTPMLPNCFVDVSDYIDVKRLALTQFETQTKRFNLVDASLGLNKYRSVMNCYGDHFVECFFCCSPEEYLRLWKIIK